MRQSAGLATVPKIAATALIPNIHREPQKEFCYKDQRVIALAIAARKYPPGGQASPALLRKGCRMRFEHLFIIDPLATLNLALDSSLRLMFELARLGDAIYACEPRHLDWVSGESCARARCQRLSFPSGATSPQVVAATVRPLTAFAAVHMRKDPPYDLDYLSTTWLLDHTQPHLPHPRVYNAPAALQRYNEKLAIFHFPHECRPALVSSDAEGLLQFIEHQAQGDGILKPLHLFGGRGVERLELKHGKDAVLAKLRAETADGQHARLVQAFDPAIYEGEVRAFTVFGKPLAWCLKKPATGTYLANTRMGAVLLPYTPQAAEVARVARVAGELFAAGVANVGFDLIGGFVSEVNLTSPRLLQAPGDTTNYYATWAAAVQEDLG